MSDSLSEITEVFRKWRTCLNDFFEYAADQVLWAKWDRDILKTGKNIGDKNLRLFTDKR